MSRDQKTAYRRCGSDKIRQTVPDASSGDRKSSVTDGRQSGAADDHVSWVGLCMVVEYARFGRRV